MKDITRYYSQTLLAAAILGLTMTEAFAGRYGATGGHGAPGPIAGAGLAYLALAGGYYAVRRWRRRTSKD